MIFENFDGTLGFYLLVTSKGMNAMRQLIIEKLNRAREKKQKQRQVQPDLPAPEQFYEIERIEQKPARGSTIIDFEV